MFFVTKKKYNAALDKIELLEERIQLLQKLKMVEKPSSSVSGNLVVTPKKPYKSLREAILKAMVDGVVYDRLTLSRKITNIYGVRPYVHSLQAELSDLTINKRLVRVGYGKYKVK